MALALKNGSSKVGAKSSTSKTKVSQYDWKGKNKKGVIVSGIAQGLSEEAVRVELKRQGVTVTKLKKRQVIEFLEPRITAMDIAMFSRQICTMLGAGVPIIQAIQLLSGSHEKSRMREMLTDIANDVAGGIPLSKAFAKYPKYFNDLYCDLVAAGEQSGALETIYDRIATYQEKAEMLKSKIKKALMYPTVVVIIAIAVTAILLVFVVPQFEDIFKGFGAELPAFTKMVVELSRWMQANWLLPAGAIFVGFVVFRYCLLHYPKFRDAVQKWSLKIPVIGGILKKAALQRFASTLSTTFAAGIPLVEALVSAAGAAGNALYRDAIMDVRNEVVNGMPMHMAMRTTMVFPDMLTQMVMIGEEAGSIDDMLAKIAGIYQQEVDDAVDGLSSMLEPLIMVILGVLIGGLVIAMYLPIFTMGSVIK